LTINYIYIPYEYGYEYPIICCTNFDKFYIITDNQFVGLLFQDLTIYGNTIR